MLTAQVLYYPLTGLIIDWRNRQLYFTNEDFVSLDGVAYTWHRVEVIGVEDHRRRAIITDLQQPRGLWIDTDNGFVDVKFLP